MSRALRNSGGVRVLRLLRCQRSLRYYREDGWTYDWTYNPAKAACFASDGDAMLTCVVHGLHEVELVLRVAGLKRELSATPLR